MPVRISVHSGLDFLFFARLPPLGDRGRCAPRALAGPSSPLRRLLAGAYKYQCWAQRGISRLPPRSGLVLQLERVVKEPQLGRAERGALQGRPEGRVAAGAPQAAPGPRRSAVPPGRLPLPSASLHPPFPRILSPAHLDPGPPLGVEAPGRFPSSLLLSRLGFQPPPSFPVLGLTLFVPLPLAQAPYPFPLPSPGASVTLLKVPILSSSFSLPGVEPVLSLPLSLGAVAPVPFSQV